MRRCHWTLLLGQAVLLAVPARWTRDLCASAIPRHSRRSRYFDAVSAPFFPLLPFFFVVHSFRLLMLRILRRGRRQFLHPARWEEVRKTWLNHGIPTLVARKLEGTIDSGGWESL